MAERSRLVGWGPDLGPPTTFVLLRHGVTALTAEKRFSGSGGSDPALTDEGLAQVTRAAAFLASSERLTFPARHAPLAEIHAVVASPLQRTRQTADAVAQQLGLEVEIESDVRECGFGVWDGLTYDEVDAGWPDELRTWMGSPSSAPPEGESFDDVHDRVVAARASLTERYRGRTVVVASHVTPIKSFVRDVLEAPAMAVFRMELAPASLTVVQWYADDNGSLRVFNHTAHLAS